jgi:DNA-binding GntR family transcriptional regulator
MDSSGSDYESTGEATGRGPKFFGEHLQILDTIEQADVKKACQILHQHDDNGMRRTLFALSERVNTL